MAVTEEVKQAIMQKANEHLEKQKQTFVKLHQRDMTDEEIQVAIMRTLRELHLTLSNETIFLVLKEDTKEISISELFRLHYGFDLDPVIKIDLEKSEPFYGLITSSDDCFHYVMDVINPIAEIYLSDFIDWLLEHYPVD